MQLVGGRTGAGASSLGSTTNRKPMLIALALGLIAAMLSWGYVQRAGQATRPAALVPVLVAAVDIPVRTQVTPQMLAVKQVAVDARHPKAFTSADQVTGKMTNLAITAGEQVLSTKFFARKEDSGLAFRVPDGMRAVSVSVSEVINTGGLINPGDSVDVLGVLTNVPAAAFFIGDAVNGGGEGQSNTYSGTVLENVEVLAVAQSLTGEAAESPRGPSLPGAAKPDSSVQEAIARPNARTVTLAVTPQQAAKLVLAEQKGQIRLALRGMDQHK